MRALIVMALCALMVGCGSLPSGIQGRAKGGPVMFGSVAAFGTFEMQLSPAYTRLAVLRHNAARYLRDKRITVARAEFIQASADHARGLLDDAHAMTVDGKPNPAAVAALQQAEQWIANAEKILEEKP